MRCRSPGISSACSEQIRHMHALCTVIETLLAELDLRFRMATNTCQSPKYGVTECPARGRATCETSSTTPLNDDRNNPGRARCSKVTRTRLPSGRSHRYRRRRRTYCCRRRSYEARFRRDARSEGRRASCPRSRGSRRTPATCRRETMRFRAAAFNAPSIGARSCMRPVPSALIDVDESRCRRFPRRNTAVMNASFEPSGAHTGGPSTVPVEKLLLVMMRVVPVARSAIAMLTNGSALVAMVTTASLVPSGDQIGDW